MLVLVPAGPGGARLCVKCGVEGLLEGAALCRWHEAGPASATMEDRAAEERAYMDSLFVAGNVPKDVQHSVRLQSYFNQLDKIIECDQLSVVAPASCLSRDNLRPITTARAFAYSPCLQCRYRGEKRGRLSERVRHVSQVYEPRPGC
jgi:hypothetical protein